MIIKIKHITLFLLLIVFCSCSIQFQINTEGDTNSEANEINIVVENTQKNDYIGWWVYGEGFHIFKDESTLEEWNLEFPNEDMEEIKELYLAVCEMEYFPMECKMRGHFRNDIIKKQKTLIVHTFEILYIQGCGE